MFEVIDITDYSTLFEGTLDECKDFMAKYPDTCYELIPLFEDNSDVGCSEYPSEYRDC